MKIKKIWLLVLVGLLSLSANAETITSQMNVQKKDFIKPYIGAGAFTVTGMASDFKAKSGIVLGASYEMATSVENLSVDTGLEYFQAGAQREYIWTASGEQAIKQELNMNYLAIPVKARYLVFSQNVESLKYKVIGGLTIAQLLSAKSKTNVFGQTDQQDVASDFHSTDLLASAGVGVEYEMLGWVSSLDFEYTQGLLEVSKQTGGHNEGYLLKAGLAVPL